MLEEALPRSEWHGADVANKRPAMCPFVFHEAALDCKGSTTLLTKVGPLARVQSPVHRKTVHPGERSGADATHKGHFTSVRTNVVSQVRLSAKRGFADLALVGSFSGVLAHV